MDVKIRRLLARNRGQVIFCFCNEPQKSLFNSIFSVIERSPRHLLKEFVLVDDGSDAPHLQGAGIVQLRVGRVSIFHMICWCL